MGRYENSLFLYLNQILFDSFTKSKNSWHFILYSNLLLIKLQRSGQILRILMKEQSHIPVRKQVAYSF